MPKNKKISISPKALKAISLVAEELNLNPREIFANYQRKNDLAKFMCYRVYFNRGLSYPQTGKLFGRDHTTIMHGIKKLRENPELMAIADKIYDFVFKEEKNSQLESAYHQKKINEKNDIIIKNLVNEEKDIDFIYLQVNCTKEYVDNYIQKLKENCQRKKIPDYAKNKIKEIYIWQLK